MKESKFNFSLQDHTGLIIYNAKSDEVIALNPQLANFYKKETPDSIRNLHPELFSYLTKKGVFVEEDADEVANFIAQIEKTENEMKEFTVTINPTLACNMKCWYCYETHKNMPAMSLNVKQATITLIKNLSDINTINRLNLSFFGGEPLLFFDRIIIGIINEAANTCGKKGIDLNIHFTTNAYLLTKKILEQMRGLNVSFQITIDGNENVHNTVRKTKDDKPTYSTIIKNIHLTLSLGFSVGVRFNYTNRSLPSFIDVLLDFQNIPSSQKKRLNFTFQRVWQDHDGDTEQIEKKVAEIERAFEEAELFVNSSNKFIIPYCYADKKNTVIINYNGDLYKCTARDFVSKNREGILTPDGNCKWNEKYKKRLSIRHGSDLCRQCRIYPICHGGCSQMKLETATTESCPKGYDEEKKYNILKSRALFILEQYKKKRNQIQ